MRRVKLTVEYDGTAFFGWQLQRSDRTVQGVLEAALRELTGEPALRVAGAGRTDAGVHALGQVAAFSTATRIPPEGFLRGGNALLPRDVAIVAAEEVDADFDPRRAARGKRYRYQVWNAEVRSPYHERWSWHVRAPLDLARMRAAAATLCGEHDFSAFRARDEREHAVRVIRAIEIAARGALVALEVEGTAFLRHMVRVIAGTLVAAGKGELDAAGVAAILAAGDRARAGVTAPPQGLFLVEVQL